MWLEGFLLRRHHAWLFYKYVKKFLRHCTKSPCIFLKVVFRHVTSRPLRFSAKSWTFEPAFSVPWYECVTTHAQCTYYCLMSLVWCLLLTILFYYWSLFDFLKEQGHNMNIFEGCKLESVLCVHAPLIFKFLRCLFEKKNNTCTASSRPFLSKEASAAYATHRKRE